MKLYNLVFAFDRFIITVTRHGKDEESVIEDAVADLRWDIGNIVDTYNSVEVMVEDE